MRQWIVRIEWAFTTGFRRVANVVVLGGTIGFVPTALTLVVAAPVAAGLWALGRKVAPSGDLSALLGLLGIALAPMVEFAGWPGFLDRLTATIRHHRNHWRLLPPVHEPPVLPPGAGADRERFPCPRCGSILRLPPVPKRGLAARCASCGSRILVPLDGLPQTHEAQWFLYERGVRHGPVSWATVAVWAERDLASPAAWLRNGTSGTRMARVRELADSAAVQEGPRDRAAERALGELRRVTNADRRTAVLTAVGLLAALLAECLVAIAGSGPP